jgi:hypothetical protein
MRMVGASSKESSFTAPQCSGVSAYRSPPFLHLHNATISGCTTTTTQIRYTWGTKYGAFAK